MSESFVDAPLAGRDGEQARSRGPAELVEIVSTLGQRSHVPRWLRKLVGPLFVLAAWQVAVNASWVDPAVIPSPIEVVQAGWRLASDGTLSDAIWASLRRVVPGSLIGVAVAVVAATVAGLFRVGEDLLDPSMQMLKTVPWIGLAPLFILWVGLDDPMKILVIAYGVFFPVYLNLYSGIRSVDRNLLEVAEVVGLSRLAIVLRVVLPGALPSFLVGLRFGLSIAWIGLIFAESLNVEGGIGSILNTAQINVQTDVIIFCLVLYGGLGLLTDLFVRALEHRCLRWRATFEGA